MIYNKENFKSSAVGLRKEELVLLYSSIRVALAKTPKQKQWVMEVCESQKKVLFGEKLIERLERMDRKELLSMLLTTNGILMKKSYNECGTTCWNRQN